MATTSTARTAPSVTGHPADRLLDAIERVGSPVCVGIDPVWSKLPAVLRRGLPEVVGIQRFSEGVVDAVAGRAAAVKLQSACFERYGAEGFAALAAVAARARSRDLVVILDAKRGDIGVSAEHYAEAARGRFDADWTTVNGYLGPEGFAPFRRGRGAFVLVRTSNPDGGLVQSLRLDDGRTVAEAVAEMVAKAGDESVGASGFSDVGAVVGATHPADAAALRRRMPRQIFLVPGFGAQGGSADDVRACFRGDGRGAVITASRSVIFAFEPESEHWIDAVAEAAARFRAEVAEVVRAPR